ncbi:MAG: GNAT family N-acetyltransferase [Flavobacteriales bacterium]|nr:GNAT family N-acetyltransferase [Flavobacteriales bacterium]
MSNYSPSFSLRPAKKVDAPEILRLIKLLAEYEKAPHEVTNTVEDIIRDGFGENPIFWVIVAEADQRIVGMSLWYIRYSTWKGKCLYLEDIIVEEPYRGKGIGKALFEATIHAAKNMQAKAMVWQVLDWNTPSIEFYKKYGCELDNTWINCKLTEEQLHTIK